MPTEILESGNMGIPRRVYVSAMAGISATVVVTVVQGKVWMSISPPLTWEAIMEPAKVDELLLVLGVAREDAKKMAAARSERAAHAGKAVVPAITSGVSAARMNNRDCRDQH